MDEENKTSESEQVKKMLEQNLKLTQEVYFMVKKIKSHLAFQRLVSIFYLIIILAPIILGIIYLPPLLGGLYNQYKDLLGLQAGADNPLENLLKGGIDKFDLKNTEFPRIIQ